MFIQFGLKDDGKKGTRTRFDGPFHGSRRGHERVRAPDVHREGKTSGEGGEKGPFTLPFFFGSIKRFGFRVHLQAKLRERNRGRRAHGYGVWLFNLRIPDSTHRRNRRDGGRILIWKLEGDIGIWH